MLTITRPDHIGIRQVVGNGFAVAVIGLAEAFAVRRALEQGLGPPAPGGGSGRVTGLPYADLVRHDLGGVPRSVFRSRQRRSR